MANLRSIIAEPRYEEEVARIEASPRVFDEAVAGILWLLARCPERGDRASPGSHVWFVQAGRSRDVPAVTIYYTFTDTHVFLLSIEFLTQGNGHS